MFLNVLVLMMLVLVPGAAGWLALGHKLRRHVCLTEALFLVLLTGVATVSWLGLILAEVGWFSLPLLLTLTLGVSLCLLGWTAWRRRGLDAFRGLRVELSSIAVLGVIVVAVLLPSRPFEYILGGRDHGIYVNTGVNIAKTGGIIIQDPELAGLPVESQRAVILPKVSVQSAGLPGPWSEGQRLPGFTLRDLNRGIVLPHAFHLYPVWIAIFEAAGGLDLALWTTFVFGLLGILGVYFAGQRLFGQTVGLLAGLLLSINVAQMWFLRYPMAEIVVQFFFWAGLFAIALMLTTHSRYAALLAGFAFGLIHLTKLDIVFLPIVLSLYFAWIWFRGRFYKSYWFLIIPYLSLVFHTAVHAVSISTVYFVDHAVRVLLPSFLAQPLARAADGYPYPLVILGRLLSQNTGPILLGLMALAVGVFLVWRFKTAIGKGLAAISRFEPIVQGVLTVGLVVAALYSYFVRPLGFPPGLPKPLFALGWYVGPLGLLLGVTGFLQALGRRRGGAINLGLWMVLGNVLPLLILGSQAAPDHFWSIRRFVPVAIPSLCLFASYLLYQLVPLQERRWSQEWPKAILPLSLTVVLIITAWQIARPLARFVDLEGVSGQLAQFAERFPAQSVLLFERSPGERGVSTPLWLIFDETVFLVENTADRSGLAGAVEHWQARGLEVYWVSSTGEPPPSLDTFVADYAWTEVIAAPAVELAVDHLPNRTGEAAATLDVYRIASRHQVSSPRQVVTLNIGQGTADPFVKGGLYPGEHIAGLTPTRWTTGRVEISVPVSSRPHQILLRMGNGRPWGAPVPDVAAYLEDTLLGTIQIEGPFQVYSLPVPTGARETGGGGSLRLEMETWNPKQAGYNQDARDLGVLLDWVKIVIEE